MYNNVDSVTNNDTDVRLSLEHCISVINAKYNRARSLGHWSLGHWSLGPWYSGPLVPGPQSRSSVYGHPAQIDASIVDL